MHIQNVDIAVLFTKKTEYNKFLPIVKENILMPIPVINRAYYHFLFLLGWWVKNCIYCFNLFFLLITSKLSFLSFYVFPYVNCCSFLFMLFIELSITSTIELPFLLCWFEMSRLSCTEYLQVHWWVSDFLFCSVNLFCTYALLFILVKVVCFYTNIFSILFLNISSPFSVSYEIFSAY